MALIQAPVVPLTGHVDRNTPAGHIAYLEIVVPLTGHVDRNTRFKKDTALSSSVVPLTGHVDRNTFVVFP